MELTGYLAVARRWWWTLLVATWVAAVSGYVVASQIPPTYEAETQLLVGPYNTDRETLAAAGSLVQTYSSLVSTTPVIQAAINEVGVDLTPDDLASAIRATANDTTRFLSIRVQATDPEVAAKLANALGDEISQLASGATSRPEGQLQVVQAAAIPVDPIAPQRSLIVGLAALAALIGAMVLVMLVEFVDASVRTDEELERLTGVPFLGRVETARSVPGSPRGLIDQAPESTAAAAYRLLVAKVAFGDGDGSVRSVVTVGTGSEGISGQVAANLAAISARSGRQVVLIDADPGTGPVTRIYGVGDRTGLTDVITGRLDATAALVRISPTLQVLPRGIGPGGDGLDVAQARSILTALEGVADLVVVSTGPLHLSASAVIWAQAGDTSILVAARDVSRRDDVEYAVESLRFVSANVAGAVLADRRRGIRRGSGRTSGGDFEQPIDRRYARSTSRLGTEPAVDVTDVTPEPTTPRGAPRKRT